MSRWPQYVIDIKRGPTSKPFGSDVIGRIGRMLCLMARYPIVGFRLGGQRELTNRELLKRVSGLVYALVEKIGEEKARLALAEYGLALVVDEGAVA